MARVQHLMHMHVPVCLTVQGYKAFISPLLPPACRFVPTCSEYAIASIQTFGPARGAVLTAWRILRYRAYACDVWKKAYAAVVYALLLPPGRATFCVCGRWRVSGES